MRVLAVDPGLTRCGLAVVSGRAGGRLTLHEAGVAGSAPELELGRRLLAIELAVTEWVQRHSPEVLAVERVFSQHNVRSAMGTAQAAAIAVLVATRAGLPVALHTPSEVKAAVTGSGTADKAQVGAMVTRLLGLDGPPRPADAADAAALAICHVWRGAAQARLAQAAVQAGHTGAARRAEAARAADQARAAAKRRLGAAVRAGLRPGVRS